MADPQTPNLGLYIPLNGSDVGTWDVPMNANFTLLDNIAGTTAGLALSNVPVTLAPAQYQTSYLYFIGALTGNVAITFTADGRIYSIQSFCTGNVSFTITLKTIFHLSRSIKISKRFYFFTPPAFL